MKEEGTIKPLHCFPSSTAHNQQTLWKGYIGVTIELRIKFGMAIKKSEGNHPLTKSNQNNRNYVRVILMMQRYKLF